LEKSIQCSFRFSRIFKLFLVYTTLILTTNNVFANDDEKPKSFSTFPVGIYGGITFVEFGEMGSSFSIEAKTNIFFNLNLVLSAGLFKSSEDASFNVKSYRVSSIDEITYYHANSYDVTKMEYDVFPVSLGLQYAIINQSFSPYISFIASYNYIDAKFVSSRNQGWSYLSYEEMPDEFKQPKTETLPENSYSLNFGIGVLYRVSKKLDLDLRYFYKIDSELVNTHNLVAGISLIF